MEVLNHFDRMDDSVDDKIISNDNVGVVLEESEIIDCDTEIDAATEEDNIRYHICQVNRNDNGVAYRVVQVQDSQPNNTELSVSAPLNNAVQVLTSPISGQLYVLSNSNEVVTTESTRTVTPRVKLQIGDNPQNILTTIKKRDERRRVTHNEVERRRRDKINNWIAKLGKLLPDYEQSTIGDGDVKTNFELQSKGGILERACEYITELRDVQENLQQSLDENAQLLEEAKTLRQVVTQLRKENSELKIQLSTNATYILGT